MHVNWHISLFSILALIGPWQSVSDSQSAGPKGEVDVQRGFKRAGEKVPEGFADAFKSATSRPESSSERTAPSNSQSIFDAAQDRFNRVNVNVEVYANSEDSGSSAPEAIQIGGEEMIAAAGSYGDFMRYLQVLPGVVASSDTSNEFLVRGGHPLENLLVVDGFEVPSLTHLAELGSTGGFAPMIDTGLVQDLKLRTGGYGPWFTGHLSSVTEISLLKPQKGRSHVEADFGIQGIGGLIQKRLWSGDLLASAHRGLLDVVTKDAGLNGVPTYTNEVIRYRASKPSGDSLTFFHLGGWDSIEVTPCESDQVETSQINSQYFGWRQTTGLRWQNISSPRSFRVFSLSDSDQVQHIHQQDQYADPLKAHHMTIPCPIPKEYTHTTPVYNEITNSAVSSAGFSYEWSNAMLTLSVGATGRLHRPRFDVSQPIGVFSPYSSAPERTDATTFTSRFASGESGSFGDLTYKGFKRLSVGFGSRLQTIAFGGHTSVSLRASAQYDIGESASLNATFATYAQMPPFIYLTSFKENRALLPMRVEHRLVGLTIGTIPHSSIHIEAYDKPYSDIPASSEFESVTLHNLPSQITDEVVWLRMNSNGSGRSSGIELSDTTHFGSKLAFRGSLAYSRAKFAGLDHIFRPSNFDFPWIFNVLSNSRLGRGYGVSLRYGFASGRPFTPYDMPASLGQNRPIFDLTRVNSSRAPYYARLDGQLNKDVEIRGSRLEIYAGADNLLNRENFLTYAWMPICQVGYPLRYPVKQLSQMPIFPNFGVRLILR